MTDQRPQAPAQLRCPNCETVFDNSPQLRFRPFCSERCKLIDLGEWINESHRIPGKPVNDPDEGQF